MEPAASASALERVVGGSRFFSRSVAAEYVTPFAPKALPNATGGLLCPRHMGAGSGMGFRNARLQSARMCAALRGGQLDLDGVDVNEAQLRQAFDDGAVCFYTESHGERMDLEVALSQVISELPSAGQCALVKVNALSVDVGLTLGHRVVPVACIDREMHCLRYSWVNTTLATMFNGLRVSGTLGSPLYGGPGDSEGIKRMCAISGLLRRDDAERLCMSEHAHKRLWGYFALTVPAPIAGDIASEKATRRAAAARKHALDPSDNFDDNRGVHAFFEDAFGPSCEFPPRARPQDLARVWYDPHHEESVDLDAVDSLHLKIYYGDGARAFKHILRDADLEKLHQALIGGQRDPVVSAYCHHADAPPVFSSHRLTRRHSPRRAGPEVRRCVGEAARGGHRCAAHHAPLWRRLALRANGHHRRRAARLCRRRGGVPRARVATALPSTSLGGGQATRRWA